VTLTTFMPREPQVVELVYSRVDADGTLREARVAPVVLQ